MSETTLVRTTPLYVESDGIGFSAEYDVKFGKHRSIFKTYTDAGRVLTDYAECCSGAKETSGAVECGGEAVTISLDEIELRLGSVEPVVSLFWNSMNDSVLRYTRIRASWHNNIENEKVFSATVEAYCELGDRVGAVHFRVDASKDVDGLLLSDCCEREARDEFCSRCGSDFLWGGRPVGSSSPAELDADRWNTVVRSRKDKLVLVAETALNHEFVSAL